ncbi:hypothetical protein [Croceivirga thetidis]|uniref:Macroglobulin domain-containing protein n=1 Tax=Croceivirga thetidis TaxID=2721623 RepID=A0ABX1GTU5_9FLAO|nr:hypothetical protein [Croceivirga thetidis]NKI32471.1 hypothetical protein [Croceivirga thetidis]
MRRLVTILILFAAILQATSQYVVRGNDELESLKKLPQEKVYLHHSGPVLFSGEYLYYALYCFNTQTNKASNISTVAYVALVNEAKEIVLEQKIKLDKGMGKGDFFVSTDIPSGNYKLLGYSNWMKNNGITQVFQDDLVVINPYQVEQAKFLTEVPEEALISEREVKMDSATISLLFDKTNYSKRESINLKLRNYKGPSGYGNYSIRVQKKEGIQSDSENSSIEFANAFFNVEKTIENQLGDNIFLPEQRGELLYGTVTDKNSNEPVTGETVVVSIPGGEFLLKFAKTDTEGNFYSYLKKDYQQSNAVLQVDNSEGDYKVELKKLPELDVSKLSFNDFKLKKEYLELIRKRSIDNQLENQFFAAKPDSILLGDPIDPFDGGIPEVVYLDDYTRFKTFEETLVEILNKAGYRNNGNERDYIRILQDFEKVTEDYNDYPAIVLIDGVFIPNHEEIRDFDARQIESISLIRDQFRMADKDYQGMLLVKTFEGNYYETYQAKNGVTAEITKPVVNKNYFKQRYSEIDSTYDRIPDYRRLLLWEPHVSVEGNELDFEFFTSDLEGEYEVILDGFTSYGKPIYFSKSIWIE